MIKNHAYSRTLVIVFLVILLYYIAPSSGAITQSLRLSVKENKDMNQGSFQFEPEDITLKDDAYQSGRVNVYVPFTEWWYFDAIFDNGYSVQVAVRVIGLLNEEITVVKRLDIYKDNELEYHKQEFYILNDFKASTTEPYVEINNEPVINGYINEDNEWVYDLFFKNNGAYADLHLVGVTKGYKGDVPGSTWVVVFPKATATGTINYNGETIDVKGVAYHDHNYQFTSESFTNYGWYWGKIYTENYTINWAQILSDKYSGDPLMVISRTNGEYINVNAEDIEFTADDFRVHGKNEIPYYFSIKIETENLKLDVEMTPSDIHFCRVMQIMRYWRYHINCQGTLTIGSEKEEIQGITISEYLRFQPFNDISHFKLLSKIRFNGLLRCLLAHIGVS